MTKTEELNSINPYAPVPVVELGSTSSLENARLFLVGSTSVMFVHSTIEQLRYPPPIFGLGFNFFEVFVFAVVFSLAVSLVFLLVHLTFSRFAIMITKETVNSTRRSSFAAGIAFAFEVLIFTQVLDALEFEYLWVAGPVTLAAGGITSVMIDRSISRAGLNTSQKEIEGTDEESLS